MRRLCVFVISIFISGHTFGQHLSEDSRTKQLSIYQDSLASLGKKFINNENDLERKNANYLFIKTLVSALKTPNSFLFPFDSVKSISIVNSPDNRFRILSWHIINQDGSYRFYGTVQMNTGGPLKMFPLEDYSPLLTNPEDSVTDNHKWYGAQYYKIVPVYAQKPYYILIGWKGNTVKSTKKVIDVLSFTNDTPVFGLPVFDGNGKNRKRVVFEYARQVSMLLKYIPDQNLIVFDHLAPPDKKMKDQPAAFGPDLTYDGYKLKNGRWVYIDNLDMRNIPAGNDAEFIDPKKQAAKDRSLIHSNKN
ncbi:hypothetical protein [Mucilaginibacter pocheonensis]|uniref:WG containing repeat-containing protein n=1 Tax=Mucilaginibacter pocheonensis TaxID=398050 RepID=A0ABU1T7X1_9SPHI|nr:hypothetical protein [Mucilaginibacter pocheonensis]MDR6941336.1 hypothetical protein [Mucilaginibacter pocheonensis]